MPRKKAQVYHRSTTRKSRLEKRDGRVRRADSARDRRRALGFSRSQGRERIQAASRRALGGRGRALGFGSFRRLRRFLLARGGRGGFHRLPGFVRTASGARAWGRGGCGLVVRRDSVLGRDGLGGVGSYLYLAGGRRAPVRRHDLECHRSACLPL